jgi:AraC-like DNA-binding protein
MSNVRVRAPELEHEMARTLNVGFEPAIIGSCVRYLEHGVPNPLVRWHWHEEYELHLIVKSSGKAFVGDYIGPFEPGHLILTGPRLPHNWISSNIPKEGIAVRDVVLQFADAPLRQAAAHIPELMDTLPLLERARYGVEFFGLGERARECHEGIKKSHGLQRLSKFVGWLGELAEWQDYRLLSSVMLTGSKNAASLARIGAIIDYITANFGQEISMPDVCKRVGMTESGFSRFFHRATGNTFTEFVNRLRVSRACQLLAESDCYIANVCYDVGFNNVANFNRHFLKLKGVTPREFRRLAEARYGSVAK